MGKGIVKLGEGNWAVKDGNLLAAKETNGRFKNTEFTVTRGTDATYVGKDGFIKTTPSFYNLLLRSENFSPYTIASSIATPNSTTAPDGTNAGTLVTAGTNAIALRFSQVVETGKTYTFSCYVKSSGSDMTTVYLDIADEAPQAAFTLTNDWQRVSTTATVTKTPQSTYHFVDVSTNGSQGDTFYIWGAQVVEGTEALDYQYTNGKEGMPRIDFTDNTDGHLLLEPQSKNLVTYSEDFSQWSNVYAILNANQPSPDGFNNAFIVEDENATAYRKIDETITTNATPHTFSVFIKKKTSAVSSYSGIQMGVGFSYVVFDSFNGTYHEQSNTNYDNVEVQDFNSNWWRLKLTATVTTSTRVALWGAISTSATNINNGATGSETFYGAQLEELSYATSIIPTNGSQVTRDAETCTGAGEAQDFNSEEGVLYAEIAALANDGIVRYLSLTDGTSNNMVLVLYYSTANNIRTIVTSGGTNYMDKNYGVTSVLDFHKVAIRWKANDFSLWVDGSERKTDTSGSVPIGLNSLSFDSGTGSNNFYGKCKAIKVYKEALSDTDLQNLTS
jgi:hypothetical protein